MFLPEKSVQGFGGLAGLLHVPAGEVGGNVHSPGPAPGQGLVPREPRPGQHSVEPTFLYFLHAALCPPARWLFLSAAGAKLADTCMSVKGCMHFFAASNTLLSTGKT